MDQAVPRAVARTETWLWLSPWDPEPRLYLSGWDLESGSLGLHQGLGSGWTALC